MLKKVILPTLIFLICICTHATPLDELMSKASSGDANAQYNLGARYLLGKGGVERDLSQAITWYEKAANQNFVKAQYALGLCYSNYEEYKELYDKEKALGWYLKASRKGSIKATLKAANIYESYNYSKAQTEENKKKAFILYKELADQDNSHGTFKLGWCHYTGYGTQKDRDKAYPFFKAAAEKKHADGIYYLGICQREAYGTKKDLYKSAYTIQRAADLGHVGAQMQTAFNWKNGIGFPVKNTKTAYQWYHKAADQDFVRAYYELGNICWEQAISKTGCDTAIKYYVQAGEKGFSMAYYKIGEMYKQGIRGLKKDNEESFKWYRKAAELNCSPAQYKLGVYYYSKGEKYNAKKWLSKAAERGHNSAVDLLKKL